MFITCNEHGHSGSVELFCHISFGALGLTKRVDRL